MVRGTCEQSDHIATPVLLTTNDERTFPSLPVSPSERDIESIGSESETGFGSVDSEGVSRDGVRDPLAGTIGESLPS